MSDCIGFKYVLALDMIVVCVTSTSLSFIPTYSEGPAKIPFANVSTDDELIAIQWSVCANDQVDHTDLESCLQSWPYGNVDLWLKNISTYLNCPFQTLKCRILPRFDIVFAVGRRKSTSRLFGRSSKIDRLFDFFRPTF